MRSSNCFFDTRAVASLRREDLVEPDWPLLIHLCRTSRLNRTIFEKVEVIKIIMFHVQMGESYIRVMFEIDRNLAGLISFGTLSIDEII